MSALVLSVEEVEAPVVEVGGLAAVGQHAQGEGSPGADDLGRGLNRGVMSRTHRIGRSYLGVVVAAEPAPAVAVHAGLPAGARPARARVSPL